MVVSHNEAGLKSGTRTIECLNEFIHSHYNVLLLQEHKLDNKKAQDAQEWCEARGMSAKLACRKDEAAREGTAVVIKTRDLSITHAQVSFHVHADSKCTVAEFTLQGKHEKIASVYLPTVPQERLDTIKAIKAAKALQGVTLLGADHNCVPDTNLDITRASEGTPYENSHARTWEAYLTSLGLRDVLRDQEGSVSGPFTRMPRNARFTRIDRILAKVTDDVQHTAGIDETFGYSASRTNPDHKAIYITRAFLKKEARGKDVQRIDVKLLEDPLVRQKVRTLYTNIYNTHDTNAWGHSAVHSLFKSKARDLLLRVAKHKKKPHKMRSMLSQTRCVGGL